MLVHNSKQRDLHMLFEPLMESFQLLMQNNQLKKLGVASTCLKEMQLGLQMCCGL